MQVSGSTQYLHPVPAVPASEQQTPVGNGGLLRLHQPGLNWFPTGNDTDPPTPAADPRQGREKEGDQTLQHPQLLEHIIFELHNLVVSPRCNASARLIAPAVGKRSQVAAGS